MTYSPSEWIVATWESGLQNLIVRAAWDAIVDRALRYRTEQGIPDESPGLLGPAPLSREVEQRVAWIAARRDIERNLLKSVAEHQAVGFGM